MHRDCSKVKRDLKWALLAIRILLVVGAPMCAIGLVIVLVARAWIRSYVQALNNVPNTA